MIRRFINHATNPFFYIQSRRSLAVKIEHCVSIAFDLNAIRYKRSVRVDILFLRIEKNLNIR